MKVKQYIFVSEYEGKTVYIVVSVYDKDIGVLNSNIESVVYLLEPYSEVEIKYYKFSPENGMAWKTYEYTKNITLQEFPIEKDHAIIGKSKIKLN